MIALGRSTAVYFYRNYLSSSVRFFRRLCVVLLSLESTWSYKSYISTPFRNTIVTYGSPVSLVTVYTVLNNRIEVRGGASLEVRSEQKVSS